MRNYDKFFWGAATSSYQVEGGIKNDWSFSAELDAGRAADHYNRFEEDFDLVKELGHNTHRFSIEWARIEPEEGKFDRKEIEHYRKVILTLRERGIEPFVTLWHFTNPIWFARLGGWKNKKALEYFKRYVDFVTKNLNEINFLITLNEPMIYVINSYYRGIWPPKERLLTGCSKAMFNLIKAHKSAYKIIHQNIPSVKVGIAQNIIYFDIFNKNPLNYLMKRISEYWWNYYFLNKVFKYQDFIGINYYCRKLVKFSLKPKNYFCDNLKGNLSDLGWEIYPPGLYYVLKDLKKYNKPIYITENGLADAKDEKRAQFIKDHIYWMKKAIKEGADVRGYFHWSLIDNFEWGKGFRPRFGLVEVDYKTMERKVRPSAYVYKEIIKKELGIRN
jgi:beta-glucosidase